MESKEIIKSFNNKFDPFFEGLTFIEKSHEYFFKGERVPISVSGVIHKFVKEVDWDAIATAIGKRRGVSKNVILAEWSAKNKLACDNGTKTHDFAENFTSESQAQSNKEEAVVKFWIDLEEQNPGRYIQIAKESRMYHKVYKFSGTCDFILYDRLTQMYIIGDWKTNEDLFKNHEGKTLLEPFDFLLDCPYNLYQIQLSLYQILLEQANCMVYERWLVYLKEDATYSKYNCYNYREYLLGWLDQQLQNA